MVKQVTKLEDGSLDVQWDDGTTGNLPADDEDGELIQAYLIFNILGLGESK